VIADYDKVGWHAAELGKNFYFSSSRNTQDPFR